MKLKFRAEPRDWMLFGMFCFILLYLVAVAVLNVASLARTSEFHGLNPFPAFGPEFLLSTIVFFFAALIGIIAACSSYIFEREKGIGISTDAKKEKGYSRWATDREMKKELIKVDPKAVSIEKGGVPLMNNGKEIWVDAGEYHNLIIGSTGCGKTESVVQPMVRILAKAGESMIITDPKGEIYEKNADTLRAKGYNIVLLNFREPQKGNAWNPLALPYKLYKEGNVDKACELLDDLAMNILYDEKSQNSDPFWEKTSADYFSGLALALFEDAEEDEINLNSINLMTTVGEEKYLNSTYIKEYFSTKDQASPAYVNVSSTLLAPSDTKGSILSVFKQKIKLFSSRENLSEMLGHNDFEMKDIGKQRTAVFIVVQDEKKTYHSLVTIFLKQCYETLIDVAQANGRKLEYKTNFILDEFANMPPLKDVDTMISAARSRNIRFTFIIQNFAQLDHVYTKEVAGTIKGNCGNIIYLISSELAALEEISKLCGEVKSKEKEKTSSTPLVTVSDLQRLKQFTMIVLRIRMMPFKTAMMPDFKMNNNNLWDRKLDSSAYPTREKQPLKLFDIKAFAQKNHEKKIKDLLGNNSETGSPIGGQPKNNLDSMFSKPEPFGSKDIPKKNSNSFDIDEMVRRIDAKIAALEEEERLEKEKASAKVNEKELPKDDRKQTSNDNLQSKKEEAHSVIPPQSKAEEISNKVDKKEIKVEETKLNATSDRLLEKDKDITDDQFFDDFFNDIDD